MRAYDPAENATLDEMMTRAMAWRVAFAKGAQKDLTRIIRDLQYGLMLVLLVRVGHGRAF